ncbi:MAG: serine--tRNA ligase [Chloroflexota bacterium]|nr:serine--tRNA ligase [Chloroflexota bacterium]
MLNIDQIRRSPGDVAAALARRGEDANFGELLRLDEDRRAAVTERDTLRATHNQLSREFGQLMAASRSGGGDPARLEELRSETQSLNDRVENLGETIREAESTIETLMLELPNLPLESTPDGLDESANTVVSLWGEARSYGFAPMAHWDLGDKLGIIDMERGAKLSGARFYVLTGPAARLERALISWMLDVHTREHGYTEMALPAMVREQVMLGSGNLPKFGDNLYRDVEEDLWLLPTAEVALTGLHRDEILSPGSLPLKYVAQTPCFRREKAAAGRDTRGIKRVHQFNKVEMYQLVEPDQGEAALDSLVEDASDLLRRLELPHRVLSLCAGDMGFQSAKTYDIEVWSPGCEEWLEVSSCSTCTDFQARRSNLRYRPEAGARPQYPHTLNGSGLALPRVIIAVLETYQREDGSIETPSALRPYIGSDTLV